MNHHNHQRTNHFSTSRKGELTITEFAQILLAIAALIVIAAIIFTFLQESTGPKGTPVACRKSVEVATLTKQFTAPQKCVTVNLGEITPQTQDAKEQKEQLFTLLANAMNDCWYQFGEGKLNPWEGDKAGTRSICFVCHTFSYTQNNYYLNYEFADWLATTIIPNKEEKPYKSLFPTSGIGMQDKYYFVQSLKEPVELNDVYALNPRTEYAITFLTYPKKRLSQITGVELSIPFHSAPADYRFSSMAILPLDQVGNSCDIPFLVTP